MVLDIITDKNINNYVKIPDNFNKLCASHKAVFIRVNVICDYGGIWLDSDILVLNSLDSLFEYIENKDGFYIRENDYHPLHIEHNVTHLCKIDEVKVITTYELFYQNSVKNVKYLKIIAEGHDTIILHLFSFTPIFSLLIGKILEK